MKINKLLGVVALGLILLAGSVAHGEETLIWTRISSDTNGQQSNGSSSGASISYDGRYVGFTSKASNLVPNDTDGKLDVFIYDRQTNQIVLMPGRGTIGDFQDQALGMISGNGRYLDYVSQSVVGFGASRLVSFKNNRFDRDSDGDGIFDDRGGATFETGSGVGSDILPTISSDGERIIYYATAIPPEGYRSFTHLAGISWYDRFISDEANPQLNSCVDARLPCIFFTCDINSQCSRASKISGNGKYAIFWSNTDLQTHKPTNTSQLFYADLTTHRITKIGNSWNSMGKVFPYLPQIDISDDGRFVVEREPDGGAVVSGTLQLIDASQNRVVANLGFGFFPAISPNGQTIFFYRLNGGAQTANLLKYDVQTGQTSVLFPNLIYNKVTKAPAVNSDGTVIVIETDQDNLVSSDTNGQKDIFVAELTSSTATNLKMATTADTSAKGEIGKTEDVKNGSTDSESSNGGAGSCNLLHHSTSAGNMVLLPAIFIVLAFLMGFRRCSQTRDG